MEEMKAGKQDSALAVSQCLQSFVNAPTLGYRSGAEQTAKRGSEDGE